ncbi:polymer-forming cytoskeletal protein [candidate division FCPU426 bacterium]|nr:polymer-forming cytoskeletal protein [candidate division FCPU426 bacterium]
MTDDKTRGVDTILGAGSDFKGQINAKGSIRIDGRIEGNVSSEEGVIIGEKGVIKGNITAKAVVVSGKVTGNVHAAKRLEIMPTGQLQGDIHTPRLAIAEGVIFKGNCDMGFEKYEPDPKFDPTRKK